MSTDIVVIGAGIHGCATALRLAQAGARVTVLERSVPGAEASSAAAGILSPGVEAQHGGPLLALAQDSLRRWPGFAAELTAATGIDLSWSAKGTLRVVFDDAGAAAWQADLPRLVGLGVAAEWLDSAALRSLEPALGATARGGYLFRDEASVDPKPLLRALAAAAEAAGVRFLRGVVQRIAIAGGRVEGVDHVSGRLSAGAVLLAAGSWAGLVEGSGLPTGAVRPVRGQMVVLEPLSAAPPRFARVVFSPRGYLVPRPDGRILCGSTMEEAGFEKAVTAEGLLAILAMAVEVSPRLAAARYLESWSNFRPATVDGLPILGPGAIPGLFYSTGHYRHGILLAPASADLVAASLLGERPTIDLEPYSASRLY
ncbi:MAG: glycine oxidase ThiO [Thermoanaerobaculia bacterium]